jgi:hypothetical protein
MSDEKKTKYISNENPELNRELMNAAILDSIKQDHNVSDEEALTIAKGLSKIRVNSENQKKQNVDSVFGEDSSEKLRTQFPEIYDSLAREIEIKKLRELEYAQLKTPDIHERLAREVERERMKNNTANISVETEIGSNVIISKYNSSKNLFEKLPESIKNHFMSLFSSTRKPK